VTEPADQPSRADAARVRVLLPDQLQRLAKLDREVIVLVAGTVTQRSILNALETTYPALRGTIRDHAGQRRPKVRIFACNQDVSHEAPDEPLPAPVARGEEPLFILGAISGG
jgi:uracil-DNA glycosylase